MKLKFCHLIILGVLISTITAQECPTLSANSFGACWEACSSDSDCTNGQLCCSNGCGHDCMTPVVDPCATVRCAAPNCSEWSPGTITPEGQCCPVCACTATDGSMVAAGTSFMDDCNTCFCSSTGVAACTLIACVSNVTVPTSTTPPGQTCPAVQRTNEENCVDVDECSSNDDCQYDRICCSDGCGGRVCSDSVEMCQLIQCDWPICGDGVQPVTSPFSCCPFCPTTTTAACPVKGQVRVDCATSCVITCANMNSLQVCPEICQLNGCECPQGSVINEEINTCVRPSDCNSTTVRTCPTIQRTTDKYCIDVDECSSDDDCQYERICCSDGCGGRVCSDSVETCAVVFCALPLCEDGAVQPLFSPFSCCPVCPTPKGITDDDGGTGMTATANGVMTTIITCGLLITLSL